MRFRFVVAVSRLFHVVPLLTFVVASQPVVAHSEQRGSVPAIGAVLDCAPTVIELQFNEGVLLTALRLHRVDGAEIEQPPRTIREATIETIALPRLEPGDFHDEWGIISPDGHDVCGAITFSVLGDC
jgi:methionine-rich copper-binding protein CopC